MLLFGCGVKNNAVASSLNKGASLAETSAASLKQWLKGDKSLCQTLWSGDGIIDFFKAD